MRFGVHALNASVIFVHARRDRPGVLLNVGEPVGVLSYDQKSSDRLAGDAARKHDRATLNDVEIFDVVGRDRSADVITRELEAALVRIQHFGLQRRHALSCRYSVGAARSANEAAKGSCSQWRDAKSAATAETNGAQVCGIARSKSAARRERGVQVLGQ